MPTELWSRIWSSIRNAFGRPHSAVARADDILKVFLEDDVDLHSTPEDLLKLFLGHLSRDREYRWDMRLERIKALLQLLRIIPQCAWIDGGDLLTVKERAYEAICARIQQLKAEQAEGVARATAALAEEEAAEAEARTREVLALMEKHRSRVQKFLEIAYRKVATPDEYGDENPKALNDEIIRFIAKLADIESNLCKPEKNNLFLLDALREEDVDFPPDMYPLEIAIARELRKQFESYYRTRKGASSEVDVASLSSPFQKFAHVLLRQPVSSGGSANSVSACRRSGR